MKKNSGGLSSDNIDNLYLRAQHLFEYSQSLRRDFHRHPELGFREHRTAAIVARVLGHLGLEVITGVAETGVVGLLEGAQPGPVILLRFDMDALPIQEETGAPYASENPGVMHACGHDGHVAVGLTTARLLADLRASLKGTIKFVFQPAEEGSGGAERMVEAGVLGNPKVDAALGMHVWNERPVGWFCVSPGPLMAGADIFKVRIEGRGGHGALPHETIDPVVASAQIISALQTIVSRNVASLDSAVISVCHISAGEAFNVIPQWAEFKGTFRTFLPETRRLVIERFESIVQGVAGAMGCRAAIEIQRMTPAVVNDSHLAEIAEMTIRQMMPDADLVKNYRTMVSEDMAYMMEKVPGFYLMVGSANSDTASTYGHHHPKFDIDETVLPRAAAAMAAVALELSRNL